MQWLKIEIQPIGRSTFLCQSMVLPCNAIQCDGFCKEEVSHWRGMLQYVEHYESRVATSTSVALLFAIYASDCICAHCSAQVTQRGAAHVPCSMMSSNRECNKIIWVRAAYMAAITTASHSCLHLVRQREFARIVPHKSPRGQPMCNVRWCYAECVIKSFESGPHTW